MITPESFAPEDFSCQFDESSIQKFIDESAQKILDDNIQKLVDGISELPTGQVSIPITEGRIEHETKKAKDSTIHFGKLLEEYILTKHSELINTVFSNEIINSFSVIEKDLGSDFTIVKSDGELSVRSFVAFSKSEQKKSLLHLERLGIRLFVIITKHINANKETIFENVPFDFIGKQFVFKYVGSEKKDIYIKEFTPRVIEVDPSKEEQNKPKSTTKKPKINESSMIPAPITSKIREIHGKGVDIGLDGMGKNTQLWTRIQDIAYGSENYDKQVLKELREIIQSIPLWRYKNPKDEEKQETWDDLIETLNSI